VFGEDAGASTYLVDDHFGGVLERLLRRSVVWVLGEKGGLEV